MGAGEAAKEMFVSGTVYTEKAAMQLSLMQGQVKAHFAELDAINRKDEQGIKSARERAKAEAVKLGDNPAYLQTVALSEAIGGPLQSAVEKQVQSTDAMYHGAKSTADQMGVVAKSLSDYNTVIQKMTKDIERANLGRDVRNVDVSGLTRGVIAIEKGGQELKTGMFRIAEAVDEEGKGIATSIRNLGNAIDMGVREISGSGGSLGAKLGEAARRSLQPEKVVRKPGESDLEFEKRQEEATGGIVGSFSKSLKEITTKGDELIVSAVKGVSETISSVGGLRGITAPEPGTEPKSRRTGSPGMANALIEDWGKGTLAMLHGKEAVLTEDQLLNLTKGVQVNSLEGAVKQMSNIVPKDVQRQAGVDIEKLFGQVQTTISNAQKSPPNVENLLGDFMAGPMFGQKQNAQYTSEVSEETKAKRKALNDEYRIEQSKLAKEIYSTIPASYSAEQRSRAIQENSQMLALKEKHRQQTLKLLEDEGKNKKSYSENERKVLEQSNELKKNILKEGQLAQTSLLKNTQAEQKQLLATGNQKSVTETVTGGGSTLRKVVDTPERVKLEKEQNELIEAYKKQRKAIADNIKKETGAQGKLLFEIMDVNPEAIALQEKFEKQNGELSKKILNERTAIVETTVDSKTLAKKNLAADIQQQEDQKKKQAGLENTANIRISEIKKLMDRGLSQADAQQQVEADAAKKAKAEIPKTSFVGADGKINLDAISFGDGNKPIIRDIKAKAAEIPEAVKPKEDEAKKQAEETAKKAAAPASEKPKEEALSATKATGKAATLDDVVSSLNSLNSKMSQLLSQSQELGSRQISATKSNSQNLYAR